MNCQEIIEQIIAQPRRLAAPPEVETHLSNCPACSQVYLEQQALWRRMDSWEAPEISPGFDRRLFARIGRRAAEPWAILDWLMRLFHPLQPSFATAVVCMLIIATMVVERGRHAPVPPEPAVVTHTLERDDPRQIQLALDDIQMLNDFEILPVGQGDEGRS